jgi:prepilin-type N-terminal cleavage/methylation domain-containing protein
MNKKGFTLIELLVVIAIIGIIAGVIVVSMDGSSDKAKDARIKSEMDNIRTRMEIIRADRATDGTGYTYLSTALNNAVDTEITKLRNDIIAQGGTIATPYASTTKYCMSVTLPSGGYWCIDSSGYAGTTHNCDGTNFNCE